jgi:TonB family protein
MSWAHYLLQVNIYLVIFYCFYKLLLDRETYFVLNRLYLVLSGLFSLAIPFLRFEMFSEKVVSDKLYISVSEINTMVSNYAIMPQTQEQYDWGRLIVMIYLIGTFIFLLHFAYQLFAINQLFGKTDSNVAFSFLNRKSVSENLPERATVDLHEDIHVKQLHTIDVIFFEVLGIITWFNPIIYLYKKSVKNIHEYLADEAAAKFQGDKETYALLLLSHAFGVKPNSLTNGFLTKSMIKKRIFMLHKQRSKKAAILKYGLFVPLFAITLVLSSATIRKNNQILAVADKIPLNEANLVFTQAIEQPLSVVNLAPRTTKLDQVEVQALVVNNTETNPSSYNSINEKETANSWNAFYKYLGDGIKYPTEAVKKKVQGNTVINFSVRRGKAMDIVVQSELGSGCDEEVIEQITNYDDFFQKDGDYSLKVTFKLEGSDAQMKNENAVTDAERTSMSNLVITAYAPKEEVTDQTVYNFVAMSNPPTYPGGLAKFYEFLGKNIRYPQFAADNDVQGKVLVSFTVEKDGSLSDIKVERKLGFGTDEEAIRVLKTSKKWFPGVQNGRAVRVKYNIPISFALDQGKKESKPISFASIRTKNYTGGESPMVIVDGDTKDGDYLKTMDANTIESISIVKDANALALYGKEGKNGVIVVTTKKPKQKLITATLTNRN